MIPVVMPNNLRLIAVLVLMWACSDRAIGNTFTYWEWSPDLTINVLGHQYGFCDYKPVKETVHPHSGSVVPYTMMELGPLGRTTIPITASTALGLLIAATLAAFALVSYLGGNYISHNKLSQRTRSAAGR